MDILNWLYLRKNQLIKKTVNNATTDLVVLGADATFAKRDDKYKTYAMTVEDFATAVALPPAYKVYTALLIQSGGDDSIGQYSDELLIGRTYLITDFVDGDFTIVGAPNNNLGTYFVATGTIPNWGTPGNNILQYNTGAPVVRVLENTIGNIWFTYNNVGLYNGVSNGLFLENKTVILTGVSSLDSVFNSAWNDEDINNGIFLKTYYSSDFSAGIGSNNIIYNAPIEIRVYN